jgi:hypothetical protein
MRDLVVNTAARVDALRQNGTLQIEVRAPVRGEGIRCTRISPHDRPEVVELLKRIASGTDADVSWLSNQDIDQLEQLGILIGRSMLPQPVPLELTGEVSQAELHLPEMRFDNQGLELPSVPLSIPDRGKVVWIRDELRCVWLPCALTAEQVEAVARLKNGMPPGELSGGMCDQLSQIGILDLSRERAALRPIWDRTLAAARDALDRIGYALVPFLLPAHLLAAVQTYYRRHIAEGFMKLGDDQALRYSAHREPLAEWLHHQVSIILKPILDGRFKPSYSFVCAYVGSASLPRHSDRVQCEVTVSLCVDASPGAERWPLFLESPAERAIVQLRIGIGHAVVFKGRELAHWRNALARGEQFTSLLFHFADAGLVGSLD